MTAAISQRLAVLAILHCCACGAPAGVAITEFLASNRSGLADEDGDRSDWIEIGNTGDTAVSLGGWHLTDKASDPTRWTFPAVWLGPGEYRVIFASGKDRSKANGELHTSFALSADGEYLALTDAAGAVVHAWPASRQWTDVSCGTGDPAAGTERLYFLNPTPGAPNDVASAAGTPPTIFPPDGTFVDSRTIALTAPESGAVIRYTTDNTDPGIASPEYVGPIVITETTRLRARTYAPNRLPGPVAAGTWIRLDPGVAGVESNLPLMIVEGFNSGRPEEQVDAHWLVIEPGSGGRASLSSAVDVSTRAGIRVRGSTTRDAAKYSLAVEARSETGLDRPIDLSGFPDAADWILQAPYEYDRALIRNALMFRLSNDAGRYAPRTRQVELYLNVDGGPVSAADYAGIYTLTERIERRDGRVDLETIHPQHTRLPEVSGGFLFKIDRAGPFETGFAAATQRMYWVDPNEFEIPDEQRLWLVNYLNAWWSALNSDRFFDPTTGYARYADPDSFADHHILNVMSKSVDAFRLSAFFYKDRHERLCAGPIWDFDRSLDSLDARDDNFNTWRGEGGDNGADYFGYPWYREMFRDPNFWQRWIDRYAAMRAGPLSDAHVQEVIAGMAAELAGAAPRNFARWPENAPRFGGWEGEIAHLDSWLRNRLNWMDAQFTRPPVADTAGGPVAPGTVVTLTSPSLDRPGAKIFYTTDGSDPRAFDDTQGQEIMTHTLISRTSAVRARLAVVDPGTAWRMDPDWDDSAWIAGTGGAGFDDDVDFDPYIGINLEGPSAERTMKGVTAGCLLRYTFTLTETQVSAIRRLKLRLRYDDGFVAWVNGVRVAAANDPDVLTWQSTARAQNADTHAVVQEDFTIADVTGLLRTGRNLLAIHGLNYGVNSNDFLIQAELLGGRIAEDGPEFAATAAEYDGPLTIQQTTHLVARAWNPAGPFTPYPNTGEGSGLTPVGSRWSAPLRVSYLIGTTPAAFGNLAIREIMYRPAGPHPAEALAGFTSPAMFEFVELANLSGGTLDLSGVRVTGSIDAAFGSGPLSVLAPGESVLVARHPDALAARYGAGLPVGAEYRGELPDSGGRIALYSPGGALIHEVIYDDVAPWPVEADGGGPSAEFTGGIWRASIDPGGTPNGRTVTNYTEWRARQFADPSSAQALPDADPDRDGITNAMEFALGTSPHSPDPDALPVLSGSPPTVTLTCRRRTGIDTVWLLESSLDGLLWMSESGRESITHSDYDSEWIAWDLPYSEGSGPDFFRVRVILP